MLARVFALAAAFAALPVLQVGAASIGTDFSGLPPGAAIFNNGTASGYLGTDGTANRVLHLTDDNVTGAFGRLYVSNSVFGGGVVTNLVATGRIRIGGPLLGHADGMSFNWAPDVPASGDFVAAEDGEGSALRVTIDTWDNGSGPDTGIEIQWQSTRIAFQHIPRTDEGDGNFICRDVFVNSLISVDAAGNVTFTYDTNTITATIPSWTGINGGMGWIARTGGEADNFWLDDLTITANFTTGPAVITSQPADASIVETRTATFSLGVDGTPPYFIQWYSNNVPIAGANSLSYSIPSATTNMSGQFYATVSNALSSVTATSSVARLTVSPTLLVRSVSTRGTTNRVWINYIKPVTLAGTYTINNGVTVNSAAYGSSQSEVVLNTSILPGETSYNLTIAGERGQDTSVLVPDPTVVPFYVGFGAICMDFSALPPGAGLFSTPVGTPSAGYIGDDGTGTNKVLHVTDNANGLAGAFVISNFASGASIDTFRATWRQYIGDGTCCAQGPADGMSFNWASDLPLTTLGGAEEGGGNGLTISFDTWDNGGGEAPAIDVKWKGAQIAHTLTNPVRNGTNFVPVILNVTSNGLLTLVYDNTVLYNNLQLPNYGPIANGRIGFYARTGGANENAWVDDLCINNFTVGSIFFLRQPVTTTGSEAGSVSFNAVVDGSPPYYYQWFTNGVPIAGANGPTFTISPVRAGMEGAQISVTVSNGFSSATSSNAILHVDLTPRVLAVNATSSNAVHILYSHAVDINTGVYEFDHSVFELDQVYGTNHNEVIINIDPTTPLVSGTTYQLTITDAGTEGGGPNITPNPTVTTFRFGYGRFCADFNDNTVPAGSSVQGSATVSGGFLHITDAANSLSGQYYIGDPNAGFPVDRLVVKYKMLLGRPDPGNRIADGVAMVIASDLTPTSNYGEEGPTTSGLVVNFDTWDNAAPDTAPAIEVRYKSIVVATQSMAGIRNDARPLSTPLINDVNGNPLSLETSNQWVNVLLMISPLGKLDLYYKDYVIFHDLQLPNYTPFVNAKIGWGGRTGGANENAWIDDLCINAFSITPPSITSQPTNAIVTETPRRGALYTVGVDGLPPYSVQWYSNGVPVAGATALSLQTPVLNRNNATDRFYAVISNNSGSVTSALAGVTVIQDTNRPVPVAGESVVSSCVWNFTNVLVLFNKPLDPTTAQNAGNYTIAGHTVSQAVLRGDGRSVLLTVSPVLNPYDNLSVTVNGVKDSLGFNIANFTTHISVNPIAQFVNGMVVIEAENFDNRTSVAPTSWEFNTNLTGLSGFPAASGSFSGRGDMEAYPNTGAFADVNVLNTPRLDYCINFPTTGDYYFWGRYVGPTGSDNSFHIGVDGVESVNGFAVGNNANANRYEWTRSNNSNSVAKITITNAGPHTFSIFMREDGVRVDKFLLTTDPNFTFSDITDVGPLATRSATPILMETRGANNTVTITWPGSGWILQGANTVTGAWVNLPFTSPLVITTNDIKGPTNLFFRLVAP